jgi:hypothetical protein
MRWRCGSAPHRTGAAGEPPAYFRALRNFLAQPDNDKLTLGLMALERAVRTSAPP